MTEQNSIYYGFNRSYEVSVWTLQDSFITVLKWSDIDHKETIQNPKMTINTDGTQNFSFNIPMSLYINGVWRDNPIWYNTQDGTLITNMRKIKVIFNKGDKNAEEVFEFIITTMEMNHDRDVPECIINCNGGLAYHELGKQGYKISLSSEAFYEEDAAEFADTNNDNNELFDEDATIIIDNEDCLHPTLDYWCNKMDLIYAETDADILDPRRWYYRVEMDWSSYSNIRNNERRSDTIYEEEYIASWDENGKATRIESYKEKERLIDEENSNLYNLTQNVAKTFGVFCRYKYLYDDNYHIIGKLVIFYNNFFNEREGILQLSYPNTADKVTRNIDSTDIVTKMYIDSVDSDDAFGIISIMNTDANKMQEDYLLNFDYLHEVKTITDEQYDAVKQYEIDIREINNQIIPIQEKLTALYKEQVDVDAKRAVADNGRVLAQERLDDNENLIKSLSNTDGVDDKWITYSSSAPDTAVVTWDKENNGHINLQTKGIDESEIQIYTDGNCTNKIKSVKIERDKNRNIVGAILLNFPKTYKMVYLTYRYNPAVYYENFRKTWELKLATDTNNFNTYNTRLIEIEEEIDELTEQLQELLDEKEELIKEFTLMMGPALREGHWTPEDYSNYGDRYAKSLVLPKYSSAENGLIGTIENHLQALWDTELFTDEQKNYFTLGVNEDITYYPHIYLSDSQWRAVLQTLKNEKTVSIVYYDYAITDAGSEGVTPEFSENELNRDQHWCSSTLGGGMQLIFVADGRSGVLAIRPALIITDAESMSDDEINHMKNSGILATIETIVNEQDASDVTTQITPIAKNLQWYTDTQLINNVIQVYPRLKIDTLNLMNNSTDLGIKYNDIALHNYVDYSVLTREDEYLITLKELSLLLNGYDNSDSQSINSILRKVIDIKYSISNASTAIYLDALQVHKENAYPKVSYTVSPTILNKNLIRTLYKILNRIININDNELKLHDAFGYVSELDLDLDHPWQDSIVVQNYNNKFEDLFSTITAQTEAMQRREYSLNETMQVVTTQGNINETMLQNTITDANLKYSFNDGKLTLTEENGILGESDNGLINVRNNGIFTANSKDSNGNWIWKSAILPEGINASLIKAGQLDTDKIMIYSGNDVRFQWNSEGLYAYRSILDTDEPDENATNDVNSNQYVVFNSDGLSLIRKFWNYSLPIDNWETYDYKNYWTNEEEISQKVPSDGVKQVEVSWDGFKMRNYKNEEIFFADASTGDLAIRGNFTAFGGNIGGWHVDSGSLWAERNENGIAKRVALSANPSSEYCIFAGHSNPENAPFSVKYNGSLIATSGEIGGWEINTDSLSGGQLQLFGKGDNPGIMTTDDIPSEEYTEEHLDNNDVMQTYFSYLYSYTNTSNEPVELECFHTNLNIGAGSNPTYTVENFNNANYYHYKDTIVAVEPMAEHLLIKSQTTTDNQGNATTELTQYLAWTIADNDNSTYDQMSVEDDPRIIKLNNLPIIYDDSIEGYNSLSADWYIKLQNALNGTIPTITINNDPIIISSNIINYVGYNYNLLWTPLTIDSSIVSGNIVVKSNAYKPTFRIEANTGKLFANYGKLGKFDLTPDRISNGVISNTKLDTNTYIQVATKTGTVNRTMEILGQCFYKMSFSTKTGKVTFTRLNGDTVNFNTAALKATTAANAAAGKISEHTLDFVETVDTSNPANNNGRITSYVKTGSGSTNTKTMSLAGLLVTKGAYKYISLSIKNTLIDSVSTNVLCLHGKQLDGTYNNATTSPAAKITLNYNNTPHFVDCICTPLDSRKSATTLSIPDGGAYQQGYTQAQNDMSGTGHDEGTYVNLNNSTSPWTYTAYYTRFYHTSSTAGTLTGLSLNYTNGQNSDPGYVYYTIGNLTNQKISDGGAYNAGYNAVSINSTLSWSAVDNHNERAKITASIQNTRGDNPQARTQTWTLSLVEEDDDNVKLIQGTTATNTTRAILNHGKYTAGRVAGWGSAWNQVLIPTAAGSGNVNPELHVPKQTVDTGYDTYQYLLMDVENENANNRIKVVQRKNNDSSTDTIVGRYIHNKYNLGWNAYYSAMDVDTKKINIDGVDYYPISELPNTIN